MEFTSYSALALHRRCPQAWGYAKLDKLVRIDDGSVHRDFGTWWHLFRAAEAVRRGRMVGSLVHAPEKLHGPDGVEVGIDDDLTTNALMQVMIGWWKGLKDEQKEEWVEVLGETPLHRIQHMDAEYRRRWGKDEENEEPLAVELWWSRQIPGVISIGGFVDLVYRDKKRGLIVVRDFKTSTDITRANAIDDLMESQLHLYSWGVQEKLDELGIGNVQAVSYDRARTKKPSQPKLTASGGLSKATSDYDLRTYLKWVGEGIEWGEPDAYFVSGPKKGQPKFGVYQVEEREVERLTSRVVADKWFDRTLTPLNRNVVTAHLNAAIDTSRQIPLTRARWKEGEAAPRNFGGACKWCDFRDLCAAEMIGGRGEYELEQFGLKREERKEDQ